MTFALTADGGPPSPQPSLMVTDDTRFYLEDQFFFVLPDYALDDFVASTDPSTHGTNGDGRAYIQVVPRGTDLASVPKVMWGLMASYGRQTLPALMHDQLCDGANTKHQDPSAPKGAAFEDRWHADNLFRHGLRAVEMDWMRRWTFWAGVTFGRYLNFNKFIAGVLGVAAFVFSTSLYAGLLGFVFSGGIGLGWLAAPAFGGQDPVSGGVVALVALGLIAAPLLLAFLAWRRRLWALLWIGSYVGLPVVALFIVGEFVLFWTRLVPWAVQAGLSALPGVDFHPGPRPPMTPTGLRPM